MLKGRRSRTQRSRNLRSNPTPSGRYTLIRASNSALGYMHRTVTASVTRRVIPQRLTAKTALKASSNPAKTAKSQRHILTKTKSSTYFKAISTADCLLLLSCCQIFHHGTPCTCQISGFFRSPVLIFCKTSVIST